MLTPKMTPVAGLLIILCGCFHQTASAQEWSEWRSLSMPQDSVKLTRLVVGINEDGRQEIFVTDQKDKLWHIWQKYPNSGWSKWSAFVAPHAKVKLRGRFRVWKNQDGRQEIFATSDSGAIWHSWQHTPNSGWNKWKSLSRPAASAIASMPAVERNSDGRQEVFALGNDGALWHVWQKRANSGWKSWRSLGAPESTTLNNAPAAGHNEDGRLEVFSIGSDGALWHIWQTKESKHWNKWKRLGAPKDINLTGIPTISQNDDGRMEIFLIAQDGSAWHIWQNYANGGWSKWKSLRRPGSSKLHSSPRLGLNKDGRLELFAVGNEGEIWHISQKLPNSGWNHWNSLDRPQSARPTTNLEVGANKDGRLEVFVIGNDGALWHIWQEKPENLY